jgi:hypothetical protein
MTRQHLPGIDGILDSLISAGHAPSSRNTGGESEPTKQASPLDGSDAAVAREKGARRGRPPGPQRCDRPPKEKVTFRISCDLIATYRDWSWEARCQLSELVERALDNFRQSRPD